MARPLSLVISKEPDTPSLDCRSGQALSSISCAISIPIETPLSCALPRRTRVAIASKAREIGLVPPLRIWSTEEAAQLRRVYRRSEEHTSELQSLMRNSYAVFCLKNKKTTRT